MLRSMERDTLATLPNAISMSRLLLAALFPVVHQHDLRLLILAVAGLTDFLDGWLARRRHQFSPMGALIDPFADRIFMLVAVCTLLLEGQLGTLEYFIFISRDLVTAAAFIIARAVTTLRVAIFKARFSGKLATVLQLVALVAVVVDRRAGTWAIGLVGVASLAAIIDYTVALWRARAHA